MRSVAASRERQRHWEDASCRSFRSGKVTFDERFMRTSSTTTASAITRESATS